MLDDALVPPNTDLYGNSNRVSILVVMDDALVHIGASQSTVSLVWVSILVVLDDALVLVSTRST